MVIAVGPPRDSHRADGATARLVTHFGSLLAIRFAMPA